jgi:hypothetical protein
MIPVACTAVPFEAPGGYGVAVSFTDLSTRLAAGQAARERDIAGARAAELSRQRAEEDLQAARQRLKTAADEQAALRRVTTLVARGAPQEEVFAVVAGEVAGCLDLPLVSVTRFETDEIAVHVGVWGRQNPSGRGYARRWPCRSSSAAGRGAR